MSLLLCSYTKAQDSLSNSTLIYSTENSKNTLASADTSYLIQEITITGNKRTRRSIILRELPFRTNESYPLPEIIEKLELAKRQLMNTTLFRTVVVNLKNLDQKKVYVSIEVAEKWYFFPQPFVRLANGSFSQWNERGRPLGHLNFGLKLTQFNFTGRGDKLHLNFTEGYTKKIGVQYQGFYFDKALKWSGSINFSYGKNREINYATEGNKLLSVKNPDGFLNQFYQGSFDVTYRPAIKTRHVFSIGFNYSLIADTVNELNSHYSRPGLSAPRTIFSYPYISYGVSFIDFDFNAYPTKGMYGEANLIKAGINSSFNLWQLAVRGARYWPLSDRSYLNLKGGAVLKLPFKQPYITQQFLGYGDAYLQGYENYIVDGVVGAYLRATVAYNLFNAKIPLPQIKWLKTWRDMPIRVYIKGFGNSGYAYNPNPSRNNYLTNKMLFSTGTGIDIILFTDVIFKFEWSFNQLGQNALYLHQ